MKILWFSNTPSNYNQKSSTYNGGGWISSLETEIKKNTDIELAIGFFHPDPCFKSVQNNVTYYPIRQDLSLKGRAERFFNISAQDAKGVNLCLRVIEDFKPDLIHIFGTESCFGLLCHHTKIPVVIHLQGLMAPYLNAWVPPFYSLGDYFLSGGWSPKQIALRIRAWQFNKHAAMREKEIMRCCKHFMGRTEWDKAYCSLYAPQATYYHCDEMLRSTFYEPGTRMVPAQPRFVSTLSGPLYKGHDMVLKTARVLIESGLSDFTWDVYGIHSMRFAEKKTKIKTADVNVRCKGVASAEELKTALLNCTAYIHTSYIDNSPNSLCEAQLLGVPVIATNVGGIASIVINGETGFLAPSNDPYSMASTAYKIMNSPQISEAIGTSAMEASRKRHKKQHIVNSLSTIYKTVVEEHERS